MDPSPSSRPSAAPSTETVLPPPEQFAYEPTPSAAERMHAWARAPAAPPATIPTLLPTRLELMDINCDCVDHIRDGPCGPTLLSAVTCHNRVVKKALRWNAPHDPLACAGVFGKLQKCLERYDIPYENPALKKKIDE